MMGILKKGVQDRSHQRRRKWRSQVLPVATTALHHFFIFLSGVPSLWCSRHVPLSLLSSISSQLSLTSYLAHASLSSIQPVSPGNSTNIILTSVHRQAGRQAEPVLRASVPPWKSPGVQLPWESGHRVHSTVRGWGVHPFLQGFHTLHLLHCI